MGFLSHFSSSIKAGVKAPDFELPDQSNESVGLYKLLKNGAVVLFFYPRDFTTVCTAEACSFRDSHEIFVEAGAQVVGVSADDVETHRKFAAKHQLPYKLLSDTSGDVHRLFGVRIGTLPGGISLSDRVTFVIDRDGIVRYTFSGVLVAGPHVKGALEALRQISDQ